MFDVYNIHASVPYLRSTRLNSHHVLLYGFELLMVRHRCKVFHDISIDYCYLSLFCIKET